MRRRLLASTGVIALVAVLLLGIPLGFVGTRLLAQRTEQRLEREADAAAVALAALARRGEPIDGAALARLAGSGHRLEAVLPDGRRITAGAAVGADPFRVRAGESGPVAVVALAPHEDAEASTGGVWLAVIVLSLVAVAAAIALALLQARRLAGPMERLARRAASIGHADAPPEAGDSGIAEVERIESALAAADGRIAEALRHEREFSANVSHQLRSPLTGLRMRLEELSSLAGDDAALAQEAEAALAQWERLMDVIAHLEELAGSRDGQPELLDLAALASEHVGAEWRPRYVSAGRALTVDPAGGVPARADPEAARQLIDVLLDNALAHGAGATHVAVAARAGAARLRVQDEGRGIDAGKVERLFERHFSSGNGGVGLAVARDLARRQGGDLRLASARPACFEALLPGLRVPRAAGDGGD